MRGTSQNIQSGQGESDIADIHLHTVDGAVGVPEGDDKVDTTEDEELEDGHTESGRGDTETRQ